MKDSQKTKEQLIKRLAELQARNAELEAAENETKLAQEALKERNRHLELLNSAGHAFSSSLDLDRVFRTALEETRELLDVTICSIWLGDGERRELVCHQATDPASEIVLGWRLPLGVGIAGWVARTGASLIVPDAQTDERHFPGIDKRTGLQSRSVLVVPLLVREKVIGVLEVIDERVDRFDSSHQTLLELLAGSAATAVENARLLQTQREQWELSEALATAAAIINRSLEIDDVLDRILAQVERVVRGDTFNIMLVEDDKARIVRSRGYKQVGVMDLMPAKAIPISQFPSLLRMVQSGEPTIIPDTTVSPDWKSQDSKDGKEWRLSYVGAPISIEERVVGFLNVNGTRPGQFGPADAQRLSTFANHAATAIENARLYEQTHKQAHQVQQIMKTVPEGVLLLDADRRIILANPIAERELIALAGAGVGDILTQLGGRPLVELLTSPPLTPWHELQIDGPPVRLFEMIARPVEAGPENQGWVLVMRDVTQEREVERQVRQQERLAAVGQLAAGIAHDFNNIMAVVLLYTQMSLRAPDLPSSVADHLRTVEHQAKRATDLIQQILDFSRRAVLERQPMDLLPLLKEQTKLLERTLSENVKVNLIYRPDRVDAYTVNADPTRIQQVIMNLAVNARDAMPSGGELWIELGRSWFENEAPVPGMDIGHEAWVSIKVTDNGMGVPADVLPHIFEPFFTTKSVGEGTGLGLAQVYGIVKQHKGHIGVVSELGLGTIFTIYLPALSVSRPQIPIQDSQIGNSGKGETILVVEDNIAVRQTLVDSLELLDYRTLQAQNGQEALAVFEQHRGEIALVLSDLVMPEMGGVALFHALKQLDPTVRLVMITGHPLHNEQDEMRSLEMAGVAAWLFKPVNLDILAQTLTRALGAD